MESKENTLLGYFEGCVPTSDFIPEDRELTEELLTYAINKSSTSPELAISYLKKDMEELLGKELADQILYPGPELAIYEEHDSARNHGSAYYLMPTYLKEGTTEEQADSIKAKLREEGWLE